MTERYRSPADLPAILPVFPLRGAILLPRATLTLNVFEARYLDLVDYVLGHGRLIAMVQPSDSGGRESPPGKTVPLREIGCAGRIASFSEEEEEGRLLISIDGIARFRLEEEVTTEHAFRLWRVDYQPFATDFSTGFEEERVDRPRLLAALRNYLKARQLSTDWEGVERTGNERLVNALSILSPFGPEEKQALLEAADLKTRAEALIALAEMEIAGQGRERGTPFQ